MTLISSRHLLRGRTRLHSDGTSCVEASAVVPLGTVRQCQQKWAFCKRAAYCGTIFSSNVCHHLNSQQRVHTQSTLNNKNAWKKRMQINTFFVTVAHSNFMYQQDLTFALTTKMSLNNHDMTVFVWPPHSAELNLVEHRGLLRKGSWETPHPIMQTVDYHSNLGFHKTSAVAQSDCLHATPFRCCNW